MRTIRPPTVEDAEALGRVHVAAWQAAYRNGLMPDEYLDSLRPEDRATEWSEGLARPPRPRFHRLLAESGVGEVVGFIVAGPESGDVEANVGEVFSINVRPDHWGAGYGSALLRAGLDRLEADDLREFMLWVHSGNHRARGFYESRGWHADGAEREQEIFGVTVPEVRYRIHPS